MDTIEDKEIREGAKKLYAVIKQAETDLAELRNICPHKNIAENLYSWRPGAFAPADICQDCGQLIKLKP